MTPGRDRCSVRGLALVSALALGCSKKAPPDPARQGVGPLTSATADPSRAGAGSAGAGSAGVAFDLVEEIGACSLGHRGTLLDLGDASTRAIYGDRLDDARVETLEREGATWARFRTRAVTLTFVHTGETRPASDESHAGEAPVFVEARVRGAGARLASLFLNGRPVGSWSLARGETRVVVARGGTASLARGTNELLVRFGGVGPRGADETLAEIDWVHVGTGEPEPSYAAPTRADAVTSAAFEGVSKRALALRAPGFARCATFVPSKAQLTAAIGLAGSGEADAEIRLHRDRFPPVVLARVHVTSASPRWTPVSATLPDLGIEGSLAMIELASVSATRGARVLFGEPRVRVEAPAAPAAPATATPARGAVLVVLGSLAAKVSGVYGGPRRTPELAALAESGTVFEEHRANTAFASGALASMLTGVTAPTHGVIDGDARLPTQIMTVADAVRQAGVATALFTANPTTSAAFGFGRGWDTFAVFPPSNDVPAVRVFDEATRWLEARGKERFLLVIHARGAHPPWDATAEEMRTLPPPGYAGPVDPKHAAELLGPRTRKGGARLGDADKTRLWALHGQAVDAHDAALGRLVAALRATGRDADTAIFVTADVAANDASAAPFAEGDPSEDAPLALPLVVRLPRSPDERAPGVKRVRTPTASLDLAPSLVSALGLDAHGSFTGLNLVALARGATPPAGRPLFAAGGERYVLRWGPFVLFGARDRETKLCDTLLEPACLADVRSTHPIALEALHRAAFDARTASSGKRPREPATIDPATASALKAWGH